MSCNLQPCRRQESTKDASFSNRTGLGLIIQLFSEHDTRLPLDAFFFRVPPQGKQRQSPPPRRSNRAPPAYKSENDAPPQWDYRDLPQKGDAGPPEQRDRRVSPERNDSGAPPPRDQRVPPQPQRDVAGARVVLLDRDLWWSSNNLCGYACCTSLKIWRELRGLAAKCSSGTPESRAGQSDSNIPIISETLKTT